MATNKATNCEQNQVNFAINGGGTNPATGLPFNKLQHGDTCTIPAGTTVTPWTTPVTVTKNIKINGGGIGVTTLRGNKLWEINPDPTDSNRIDIGNMSWGRTGTAVTFRINGSCPIDEANIGDPTLSGGFRLHHIYTYPDNATGAGGQTFHFMGWSVGVVDHCIWDFVTKAGTPSGGQHIIVNHNNRPNGGIGFGDYSWTTPFAIEGPHLLFFDDCLFKRYGGIDTGIYGGSDAGGARYATRHCTSWAQAGGGHESRSDGASNMCGSLRFGSGQKNLYVRDGSDIGGQSDNFIPIRQGESLAFGNRFNRWGSANLSGASSPIALFGYGYTASNTDNAFGPPDGTNLWDINASGPVIPAGPNCNIPVPVPSLPGGPQFTGTISPLQVGGALYAQGTDADSDYNFSTNTGSLYKINFPVGKNWTTNMWRGFTIRNLALTPGIPTPTSFSMIASNTANTLIVSPTEESNDLPGVTIPPGATKASLKAFRIQTGQTYEIRFVKRFHACTGGGSGDGSVLMDSGTTGGYYASVHREVVGGGRQWLNESIPGVSQWDNKYTRDPNGSVGNSSAYTYIENMGVDAKYMHYTANVRNGTTANPGHPGVTYNAATTGTVANRVGADDEVWDTVPASFYSRTIPNCTISGTTISAATANFTGSDLLGPISGSGIPNGTTITNVPGTTSNTATISTSLNLSGISVTVSSKPIMTSFDQPGVGGWTYPHPFVQPFFLPTPKFTPVANTTPAFSTSTTPNCAAIPSINCFKIKTSGFIATPTISRTGTLPNNVTFSSSVSSNVATCTFTGTAAGNATGTYSSTVSADSAASEHAEYVVDIQVSNPNVLPTGSVTSPTEGTHFTAPGTITVSASASDSDGSIAQVAFYYKIGAAARVQINQTIVAPGPYTTVWTNVAAASYAITADVTDNSDATVTTTAVNIVVDAAPQLPAPQIVVTA